MRIRTLFLIIIYILSSKVFCEKTEILPVGSILSAASEVGDLLSKKDEADTPISETVPKIHLKIIPSKKLHITQSDMAFLLTELKQEIRRQIAILADELEQKERMRQRAASIASISERLVFPSENEEVIKKKEVKESAKDVSELIDSLNEITNNDNVKVNENRTYNIEIKRKTYAKNELDDSNLIEDLKQKSLRNGPFTD